VSCFTLNFSKTALPLFGDTIIHCSMGDKMESKYRILSLDGGGIWSLIQVMALREIYGGGTNGRTLLAEFDLVAANSGGSLVLGGLLEDLTLDKLFNFFQDKKKREAIFSPNDSLIYRILRAITRVGPKYSTQAKVEGIKGILPNRGGVLLREAAAGIKSASKDIHLLIIGFDYDRNVAAFFRSAPVGRARPQARPAGQVQAATWGDGAPATVTLAEAIHASSTAPVNYFDLPADFPPHRHRYWDGGVTGCNNPIVAAVTEALVLDKKPTDIAALSIGTGTISLPWPQQGQTSPFYQALIQRGLHEYKQLRADILKLATSILDDPPDIATFLAHVMTGGGAGVTAPADSRIVRLSPLVSPIKVNGEWQAPGGWEPDKFAELANMDIDVVDQGPVNTLTEYAQLWIDNVAPNQPIRKNGTTLEAELGFGWFKEAVAAWQTIR
jgi:hypothetical protein